MAYASWSVSFGEQPSEAKWNILGTNDAYFDGLIGSGTAYTSYTPTFANTTLGNGTVAGKYQQFGKTVFFRASFILGSTSAVSTSPTVTLPVTSASSTYTASISPIGNVYLNDNGVASYASQLLWATTSTASFPAFGSASSYVNATGITSTIPFTWATADGIYLSGTYEAA